MTGLRTAFYPLGNVVHGGEPSPYDPGQVVFSSDSTPSATSVEVLANGVYKLILVGGGASGKYLYQYNQNTKIWNERIAGGGSGSYFEGYIQLNAGTYTIQKGTAGHTNTSASPVAPSSTAKNSIFGNCTAYAGSVWDGSSTSIGGAGGALPSIGYTVLSTVSKVKGNDGTVKGASGQSSSPQYSALTGTGGAAKYSTYGRGETLKVSSSGKVTISTASTDGLVYLEYYGSFYP